MLLDFSQSGATGGSGDMAGARRQFRLSIICTVAGIITAVVGVIIIVAIVLGVVLSTPAD